LKNWEFHSDTVSSIFINETNNQMLTASRNGEIILTDINRGCFMKIDNVKESVTSIGMNSNLDIIVTTSGSKLYEYVSKSLKLIF